MAVSLHIEHACTASNARAGRVQTPHGTFQTPAFMPVGTRAALKGILPQQVAATGSEVVLANTYHLMLRPGSRMIQRRGGLHHFMGWPGPILTDSGGYQVYSMGDTNRVTADGVEFKSIVDGSRIMMTPEVSIQTQHELGADIIMAFDDCPPSVDPATESVARLRLAAAQVGVNKHGYDHGKRLDAANERTIRWLERCAAAHEPRADVQALFGIVQGGTDLDRRTWSAERVTNVELPGYAIGGVAVGEGPEEIAQVVAHTAPLLPVEKPRYLMGVGYERDIVAAVRSGVDMFDCVLPTRNGRSGSAFTREGQLRLKNAKFAEDDGPLEEGCDCPVCNPAAHGWDAPGGHFSRAYIRSLLLAGEMLGPILLSLHNVRHYQRLMVDIRRAIREHDWSALGAEWPVVRAALPA